MTRKDEISNGIIISIKYPRLAAPNINNNASVMPQPLKNKIKSTGVKNPNINCDFLVLAGIK